MSNQTPGDSGFGGEEGGPGSREESRFVVLPAPLELTVSYGPGTGRGPEAILTASRELEFFDEETGTPYWEPGEIHTLDTPSLGGEPEKAVEALREMARPVVRAGKFLLTLGGEHTVTAGPLRAVVEEHPAVGLLVIDAHLDLRDSYDGTRWSHACVMRRVLEEHAIPVVWCGTRSYSRGEADLVAERGLTIWHAHDLPRHPRWIEEVVDVLPEVVYLSVDVDGLDPSVMPGTGTPEPGGLTYREILGVIEELARRRTLVAADLVEVAPIPGQVVSEFTAARIAAKIIGAVRRYS